MLGFSCGFKLSSSEDTDIISASSPNLNTKQCTKEVITRVFAEAFIPCEFLSSICTDNCLASD